MKWALVVYFLVNGTWQTAESLKYDGWYRMHFHTKEKCLYHKEQFNITNGAGIKGVCESTFVLPE